MDDTIIGIVGALVFGIAFTSFFVAAIASDEEKQLGERPVPPTKFKSRGPLVEAHQDQRS